MRFSVGAVSFQNMAHLLSTLDHVWVSLTACKRVLVCPSNGAHHGRSCCAALNVEPFIERPIAKFCNGAAPGSWAWLLGP